MKEKKPDSIPTEPGFLSFLLHTSDHDWNLLPLYHP